MGLLWATKCLALTPRFHDGFQVSYDQDENACFDGRNNWLRLSNIRAAIFSNSKEQTIQYVSQLNLRRDGKLKVYYVVKISFRSTLGRGLCIYWHINRHLSICIKTGTLDHKRRRQNQSEAGKSQSLSCSGYSQNFI